ncbi:MAG: hypothetical protein RIM72_08020 [Alphaproteobacteria bacterium]
MILEALEYLVTPCPRWARTCGYPFETMGYHARYRRNRAAWQPHLDKCKQVIRDAISLCPSHRTAIVAGSGYGFDLPLDELAGTFDRVFLMDAIHPWNIRAAALTSRSLKTVHADLTNVAKLAHKGHWPNHVSVPAFFLNQPDVDLVISANVISQLSVIPLRQLGRRVNLDPDRSAELEFNLIARHIDWLNSFDAVRVLTGDEARTEKKKGETTRTEILADHQLAEPIARWDWHLAPDGEIGRRKSQVNHVAAWTARPTGYL